MRSFGKIRRAGNSLTVAIPREMVEALNWTRGDDVLVVVDGEKCIIQKIDADHLVHAMLSDSEREELLSEGE